MHRIVYLRWLAPVLAAFLLAGCGVMGSTQAQGPPPKTLSRAGFVRLADRACKRARRGSLKRTSNFGVFESEMRKVFIPAQEHLLVALRELVPPRSDAASFQRWLGTFDQLDITIHHLLDAADAGRAQRVKDLVKHLEILGKRFDSQAAKLGLPICAKD